MSSVSSELPGRCWPHQWPAGCGHACPHNRLSLTSVTHLRPSHRAPLHGAAPLAVSGAAWPPGTLTTKVLLKLSVVGALAHSSIICGLVWIYILSLHARSTHARQSLVASEAIATSWSHLISTIIHIDRRPTRRCAEAAVCAT